MGNTKHVVDLGSRATVAPVFSYPPNCHEVCFLPQTLEETVRLYIRASMDRDLLTRSDVSVRIENDRVMVELAGSAATPYADMLQRFVGVGTLGLEASLKLNADKKWRYNWRFFLPLGLAMTRHKSVELLHFPPDYTLSRDQDYLSAHTTIRWAELLVANGVMPHDTSLYQNIIDIAPIAAPSDDGRNLEHVYAYYNDYITGLLKIWLPTTTHQPRPMIAFGSPVRDWIKAQYKVDLKLLHFATLAIAPDLLVPTLSANHPSFIYNAVDRIADDPTTPSDERLAVAMRIMQQDLIAANWQVMMGMAPGADPKATLDECTERWTSVVKQKEICELTYQQVFNKDAQEAAELCARLPVPHALRLGAEPARVGALDEKVAAILADLGALDGREPHDISR